MRSVPSSATVTGAGGAVFGSSSMWTVTESWGPRGISGPAMAANGAGAPVPAVGAAVRHSEETAHSSTVYAARRFGLSNTRSLHPESTVNQLVRRNPMYLHVNNNST